MSNEPLTINHHLQLKPTPDMVPQMETNHGTQLRQPKIIDSHFHWLGMEIPIRGVVPNIDRVVMARVSNAGGVWRLTYKLRIASDLLPPTGKVVGVDPGIYNLITTSKGLKIKPHPAIVRIDKRIDDLENERDAKQLNSIRYRETTRLIERLEQRLHDVRLHQFNEIANNLTEHNDVIAFEDIEVETGAIHHPDYLKAGRRARWDLLKHVIEYRCIEKGRRFVLVPRWWTSQTCSECRQYVQKSLDNRIHQCPHCGYCADRDVNGAREILNRGMEILDGSKRTDWHPVGHKNFVPDYVFT